MKAAVVVFPGSNRERDMAHALRLVEAEMRVAMALTSVTRIANIDRTVIAD